jgi:hypothetical protein
MRCGAAAAYGEIREFPIGAHWHVQSRVGAEVAGITGDLAC